ncbi:hypothetical protein DK847_14740 [Aestuariivirga litoralis]|uniref:Flagellar biosynthesis protein FliO n=1 Tax=Aestuariivirga litoralis TaxID=2650924 RepID=A0A2W2ATP5_9HYPH|nr:flagellar biosynthetic protein FliO [Aestuariivirga litoralis]PZF75910.1 hypothetical protein DK847_14740 [Aestuariivirga litoralis]
MEFLNQNIQVIVTAAIVLAVLFILLAVWRAFSPRVSGGRRGQRLGISEYYEVDKERRLVIVRRDNVEHLLLIGGPQDLVIEAAIGTPAASPYAREALQPGMARPAPRAPVFKTEPMVGKAADPGAAPPPIRTREEPEL